MYEKAVLLVTLNVIVATGLSAQSSASSGLFRSGKSNSIDIGVSVPVGEFSRTHFVGIGAHYSWSNQRFGRLKTLPKKLIGFTGSGGVDYYFGKGEIIAGNTYVNAGYIYFHAFGGAMCNFNKRVAVSLTTGPTLGIYKGNAHAGLGAGLSGNYNFSARFSFKPGITFLKHKETAALWLFALRVAYYF